MKAGIVGNCTYSALIEDGAVRWLCWPRMDSSFVFGPLLDEEQGGAYAVTAPDATEIVQEYIPNTNVLRTEFRTPTGRFELLDFAPRFHLYERYYKPTMLVRILRRLEGQPRVQVCCRPVYDYGKRAAASYAASNHIEFTGLPQAVRLTTNVPLTYVEEGKPFVLTGDRHLVLTWGQPLESGLEETAENFLARTTHYWRDWVRSMRVPREYQEHVIRSALCLKLHQFDDTGAIIAATTTSLPEHPGSGRTWDYRYCWLRDAYFTMNAFERLGHSNEMERFLGYLRNLVENHGAGDLRPLYAINGDSEIEEKVLEHLAGFRGDGPVRIGNAAWRQEQYDSYGEMILAISRILLDVRFLDVDCREGVADLVETMLCEIENRIDKPDAGPWELRGSMQLHSFTLLAHWAGGHRAAEVGEALGRPRLVQRAEAVMDRARTLIETRCWSAELGAITQAADKQNLDAASLLALHFRFFSPGDPRARSHVHAVRDRLRVDGGLLRRYDVQDDFGHQEAAFTVCSFWLAEALAMIGDIEEARELFEKLLGLENGLGLFTEDILPATGEQSGNFPQAYSHVGVINTAFRLSRDWDD